MLSKQGLCSRTVATRWVLAGRVAVHGRVVLNPEFPVPAQDLGSVSIDGRALRPPEGVYLMLNKPRGLVTTTTDEQGRETVYRCFDGAGLGWIAPVGRLDKASEGLLLFTNDPGWAARITDPATGPHKRYHVQVDELPDAAVLRTLETGVDCDGERLQATGARLLRSGGRNAWLEIVLAEGRNRQIRRLMAACGLRVLRLVRVAIGDLALGQLGKGQWRRLEAAEITLLAGIDWSPPAA
ncbi:pseudouridine synthase [Luteimonas vadosa]|uniref:Pseudouridine synthase n=1 Tax=Luteimonas vadosa TaxID=1165507 RepID=A0ABP9E5B9_9GAMM